MPNQETASIAVSMRWGMEANFIKVTTGKAILILTLEEYRDGISRGKAFQRAAAKRARLDAASAKAEAKRLAWIEK